MTLRDAVNGLVLVGLIALTACSGGDTSTENASSEVPRGAGTALTMRTSIAEWSWEVPGDKAPQVMSKLELLVPKLPPKSAGVVVVTLELAEVGKSPEVNILLEWGDKDSASLIISAADAPGDCAERSDADWAAVTIRDVAGCETTNSAGLYFATWSANGSRYLFESESLSRGAAIAYLNSWESLR